MFALFGFIHTDKLSASDTSIAFVSNSYLVALDNNRNLSNTLRILEHLL